MRSINPATGELLREYDEMGRDTVRRILAGAADAFASWRDASFAERGLVMDRAAALLRDRRDEYARLMALEMGKPVAQGRAEVDKCAWVSGYYTEQAARFLAPHNVPSDASRSYVDFSPLGVVLAVMPWNYPFWQVFRFAAPALMAGNAAVLKHASNVSGCALAIEALLLDAGAPAGLFSTVLVGTEGVGEIIDAPEVKAVTLTGSTAAGRSVASRAGAALKKTVLELGGSDPYLVLEDADLEEATSACVTSRLLNAGQSCIAAKRFIVVQAVAGRFEQLLVDGMRAVRVGDPLDEATEMGPLARPDLCEGLQAQVAESVRMGARLLLGGLAPDASGSFYPPTVLAGVGPGMPAWDDELFGPVAALRTVADEAEAIRAANDSAFGLGAAVFTRDIARGERVAAAMEAGICFVNSYVKSDPRLPFGGVKLSGYGRELGEFGIREFVNVKTIYVK